MNKTSIATFLFSMTSLSLLVSCGQRTPTDQPPVSVTKADIEGNHRNGESPVSTPAIFKTNSKDSAEMILIPASEFTMGGNDVVDGEQPVHKVMVDAYYIYKNPVTVAQYLKFCADTGHPIPTPPDFNPNWSKADHPIVNVSWNDAQDYCAWADVKLPTEAQWEKAARGTDGRSFPWSETFDTSKLQCSKNGYGDAAGTAAVGSYPTGASPYGVLDMAGNVWQWCSDWYDADFYSNSLATKRNPENQSVGAKTYRALRGGSWDDISPDNFRCAGRLGDLPDSNYYLYGFRCAVFVD